MQRWRWSGIYLRGKTSREVVLFPGPLMVEYNDSRYAFYRIIGAPVPMERHFFAYGESDLVDLELEERQIEAYKKEFPQRDVSALQIEKNWNADKEAHIASYLQEGFSLDDESFSSDEDSYTALSRDLPSWTVVDASTQKAVDVLRHRQRIRSRIPFVEAVYLTGSATFNIATDRHVCSFIVVADIGRARHVRRNMQRITFLMKLFSGTPKYTYTCEIVCDRTTSHFTKLKRWYADVGFVYQLAHAVQLYGCSESHPSPLYFHNRRLTDYLPDFPLKPSIRLGIECVYGKAIVRSPLERLGGGWLGDMGEALLRSGGMLISLLRKSWITTKHLIVKRNSLRKKIMLQRKMSRAKAYTADLAPWSRSLFDR